MENNDKPLVRIKCMNTSCGFQWNSNEPEWDANKSCPVCGRMELNVEEDK